jgi:AcrR family transcriptional regulator
MGSTASDTSLREKILQEAIEIVEKHGGEGVTMRFLAERLGYSPATIYQYFRNKRELLQVLAAEGFDRLAGAVESSLRLPDPVEAMVEGAKRYIDFGLAHPEIYRLMFQDTSIRAFTPGDIISFETHTREASSPESSAKAIRTPSTWWAGPCSTDSCCWH